MLKIQCPNCTQNFIWTDDMPFQGKCPNPDCEGAYDVHAALKKSIAARQVSAAGGSHLCPACGLPIPSRWMVCSHCGQISAGSRAFRKRDLLFLIIFLLLALSVLVEYGPRL